MNEPASKSEAVIELAGFLLYLAVIFYLLVPSHLRRLLALRATAKLKSSAGRLAELAALVAMRRELAGTRPGYELPETLSRVRDAAGALYERLRAS